MDDRDGGEPDDAIYQRNRDPRFLRVPGPLVGGLPQHYPPSRPSSRCRCFVAGILRPKGIRWCALVPLPLRSSSTLSSGWGAAVLSILEGFGANAWVMGRSLEKGGVEHPRACPLSSTAKGVNLGLYALSLLFHAGLRKSTA